VAEEFRVEPASFSRSEGALGNLLTQRFARHANPITTVAYTHPSDEELYSAIAGI
jgi:hypothetical protein